MKPTQKHENVRQRTNLGARVIYTPQPVTFFLKAAGQLSVDLV